MYLLPAGEAPRSKTKWRGLGVIANGGGSFFRAVFPRPMPVLQESPKPIALPVLPPWRPTPMPPIRFPIPPQPPARQLCQPPGDASPVAGSTWDPVNCRWVMSLPQQIPSPVTSSTTGTPVPAGFPVNQFFVAPDGSVWEYSAASKTWLNTGTPYNVGAPAAPTPTPGSSSASTPAQPVSVTVNTPAASSGGYQAILDWLTQQTLISGIPNWVIAGGGVLLAYKMSSGGKK